MVIKSKSESQDLKTTTTSKSQDLKSRLESQDLKTILDQLQRFRFKRNLTVKQLSKRLKTTSGTVYRWLNGSSSPSPIHLFRVTEILKEETTESQNQGQKDQN